MAKKKIDLSKYLGFAILMTDKTYDLSNSSLNLLDKFGEESAVNVKTKNIFVSVYEKDAIEHAFNVLKDENRDRWESVMELVDGDISKLVTSIILIYVQKDYIVFETSDIEEDPNAIARRGSIKLDTIPSDDGKVLVDEFIVDKINFETKDNGYLLFHTVDKK